MLRSISVIGVMIAVTTLWGQTGLGSESDPVAKKVIFISGPCEHSPGSHEADAAARLLKYCLAHTPEIPPIESTIFYGWPEDSRALDGAATLVFTGDGFPPVRAQDPAAAMREVRRMMARGCGMVGIHFALGLKGDAIPEDSDQFLVNALGGGFAPGKSKGGFYEQVRYVPSDKPHPIHRGWQAFSFRGESYWNIDFGDVDRRDRWTPIAETMLPPENPQRQVVVWAFERKDGGRSVGIAPPHYFREWRIDDLRTLVLNGILWSAKVDVPAKGARCPVPDLSEFAPGSVEPTWLPPKWRK
jgi:type 1 glutamine amidotransferase